MNLSFKNKSEEELKIIVKVLFDIWENIEDKVSQSNKKSWFRACKNDKVAVEEFYQDTMAIIEDNYRKSKNLETVMGIFKSYVKGY